MTERRAARRGRAAGVASDPVEAAQPAVTVIAIDGPAGAGKSTVGRALAERLGLEYLDTGAMYRAMTYAALRRGIAEGDLVGIAEMAPTVEIEVADGHVIVDGEDATAAIRGREVTEAVSQVAANPAVRAVLVERQRAWVAERGGGVVEGRDIGSVVFPAAQLKLYVTASARERAQRRVSEIGGALADVEAAIVARDRKDSSREHSPLTEPDDAVVVDTTDLTIEQVVERIVGLLG